MDTVLVLVETIVKETDLAFLLRLEDDDERWCPKSVIEDADDYEEGDEELEISIARWWAEQEGLV